ncbi:MAG: 3'-5' exonuclease [Halothiobacillaceae bacterium]
MNRAHRQAPAPTWPEYFAQMAEAVTDPALARFYAAGTPSPEARLDTLRFLALDFETTGMDARRDEIVSIGMLPFDIRSIRPAEGHYWIVRPRRTLRPESIAYHRITDSQVARAPDLDEMIDPLLETLAGHVVVVHYHLIERPFLDHAVAERRGAPCLFPLIDTMELEAARLRGGRLARLKRWFSGGGDSLRLGDVRARYGLPAYTGHHAKLDALATAELFLAQVAHHYSPDTPLSALWR